jgi:hypothetical protein
MGTNWRLNLLLTAVVGLGTAPGMVAAKAPVELQPGSVVVRTSGGLTDAWNARRYRSRDLWAYRPVHKPVLSPSPRHPIDRLLEQHGGGADPAPFADRRTLLRRVTHDLTGLPPTPDEVDAFLADRAPDDRAFASLVERLLRSPHYGERWGRHWLDVVRYADSAGFSNDYDRGGAWRYRDYVVRSFNADKPYDRFVREQLAGDEIAPGDPEALVAVGFLRMGPWELTGMEVARVARQRYLDDVTDTVGQAFLGHALQCARCHDHKYDPIPTRDYYRFQAAFATTQLAERPAAFLAAENRAGFDERRFLERRREGFSAFLRELDERSVAAAAGWLREQGLDPSRWDSAVAQARKGEPGAPTAAAPRSVFGEARAALLRAGTRESRIPPQHLGFSPSDFGRERIARKGLERLRWELERYEPFALSVYSGATPSLGSVSAPLRMPESPAEGEAEVTAILTGGDPFAPASRVEPGALSAVAALSSHPAAIPAALSARRRALAEWIISPRNPLTARVMVNRIWQWHFGRPLVGTPNNFGVNGSKPTHPELLDWLAATFVERGWSIKAMHRLILSSEAYRRVAASPRGSADPASVTVLPRRLDAEELRDSLLAISGELNSELGGIPARPELDPAVAFQPRQVMGTFVPAWEPSTRPERRHRRSLYVLVQRGAREPFLELFNAPSPDLSCERREQSTVAPQALALLNSRDSRARALALAASLRREHRRPADTLRACFRRVLCREPTRAEAAETLAHWRSMTRRLAVPPPAAAGPPRELAREAVEENTGERFRYVERLYSAPEFVPDLQPGDVDAETRGLAEVCLVLFNSNEFAYVY